MPRADDVHAVANRMRGGWNVTRAGRRLSHHRTQKEAPAVRRSLAGRAHVDLVTHRRDDRIRSKDSYGNEGSARDTEH
jgi:hypothetical protein